MLPEDEQFVNGLHTATLLLIAADAGNLGCKLPGMTQAFDDMLEGVMEQNAARPKPWAVGGQHRYRLKQFSRCHSRKWGCGRS